MKHLELRFEAGVATVTLNRPEVRNAFNDEVIAEMTAVFLELAERDEVRCIVLAANGPAFCAGADLNWMKRMADYTRDENMADAAGLAKMLRVIYAAPSRPSRACRATCTRAAPAWSRPATSRCRSTRPSTA